MQVKKGYTQVGRHIFGIDTQRMQHNRVAKDAKPKQEPKKDMPRAQANGPIIIDHMEPCEGLTYTLPLHHYRPLRSNGNSKAQSIFGKKRP